MEAPDDDQPTEQPTERRTDRRPGEGDDRPWTRSPWVWTAAVVLLVAGAWGVSVLVGTDYRDPDVAGEDTTAFCAAIAELSATESVDASGTNETEVAARFARLAEVAPPSMQATIDQLAVAADRLAVELDAIDAATPDPAAAAEQRAQAQRRFTQANDADLDRYETYIAKACGPVATPDPDGTVADGITGPTLPGAGATTTSAG